MVSNFDFLKKDFPVLSNFGKMAEKYCYSSESVCTDSLHRVNFAAGTEPEYIILSYYNSISFAFTELCGRSYGGGVLELLPTETGNIYLPVLNEISDKAVKNMLQHHPQLLSVMSPFRFRSAPFPEHS